MIIPRDCVCGDTFDIPRRMIFVHFYITLSSFVRYKFCLFVFPLYVFFLSKLFSTVIPALRCLLQQKVYKQANQSTVKTVKFNYVGRQFIWKNVIVVLKICKSIQEKYLRNICQYDFLCIGRIITVLHLCLLLICTFSQ